MWREVPSAAGLCKWFKERVFSQKDSCPGLGREEIFLSLMLYLSRGGFRLSPAQLSPWITSEQQTSPLARRKMLKELICSWGPQWGLCNSPQLSAAPICQQQEITKLQAREDAESSSAHWNKSVPPVRALPYQCPCPSDQTPCTSAGLGLTCWRAALWRGTCVSWWMTG